MQNKCTIRCSISSTMQNLYTKYIKTSHREKLLSYMHFLTTHILDLFFPVQEIERQILELKEEDFLKYQNIKNFNEKCVALFQYRQPIIKRMIWLLKYHNNAHVSDLFAKAVGEYLTISLGDMHLFSNFSNPILIPIPISHTRLHERGFNQTKQVAEKIISQFPFISLGEKNALIKYRDSKPQTTLARKDRLNNVKDTFKANDKTIYGQNIILLDDVITTGSTLKEAEETLLKAGAKNILCIAIAY